MLTEVDTIEEVVNPGEFAAAVVVWVKLFKLHSQHVIHRRLTTSQHIL